VEEEVRGGRRKGSKEEREGRRGIGERGRTCGLREERREEGGREGHVKGKKIVRE